MKKNTVVMSVVAMLLFAGVAGAAAVYSDNLDNVAPGANPQAQVGTWIAGNANAGTGLAVPPSLENYLDNDRKGDVFPEAGYAGDFVGDPLTTVGLAIHAEQMVYSLGGYPSWGLNVAATNLYPWDPITGDAIMGLSGSPTGSTVYTVKSNGGLQATGLTHLINAWEKWQIDWVIGASQFTLTVGANSVVLSGINGMKNPGATAVGAIWINTFSGTTHTLHDNILVTPEPATLAVMSLGMLLIRRRRQA